MDLAAQGQMLANRLRKSFRKLHGPFERRSIGAFRLYDRDIPELRLVIDWYEGHLVVGEYARSQTEQPGYLAAMGTAAAAALDVPADRVHLKERRTRPKEGERYQRLGRDEGRLPVREGDLSFLVNLDDYLDTGLFNDHRETRARVRAEAAGKSFLNLFGYTGSFTCAAARGGATGTCTVDASSAYLDWAKDNLAHNGLGAAGPPGSGKPHQLVRGEVEVFLREAAAQGRRFSLCVLDPPSFSDRAGGFEVQRDHRTLIERTLAVLAPGGVLWFSTNHQRFEPQLSGLGATELTAQTVPEDYRNRTAHRSFRLVKP